MSGVIWNSLVLLHFSLWWTPSAFWTYQKDNLKTWKLAFFFFASVARHSPVFIKCLKLSFLASIASFIYRHVFMRLSWSIFVYFQAMHQRMTQLWVANRLWRCTQKCCDFSLHLMKKELDYGMRIKLLRLNIQETQWMSAASCYIPISHFYFS